MTTFAQGQATEQVVTIFAAAAGVFNVALQGPPLQPYLPNEVSSVGTFVHTDNVAAVTIESFPGEFVEQSSGGFDWFEDFHVIERSYDFGNLLSSTTSPLEVFSAFRKTTNSWTTFVNNAGAGTDLDVPILPRSVAPFEGIVMTLSVDVVGDAFVDGSLDFTFDNGSISVPVTIQRIVLWGLEPELPFRETLESLTDIITSKDGSEKRTAVRDLPRQSWEYRYIIQEGTERQTLENLLFDFQSRTFGVPVWIDDTELTAATIVGATEIFVGATAFRDFRVGSLAIVLTSQSVFDVAEISVINASSIELDSSLANAYAIGTKVFPLVTCTARPMISGARPPVGLSLLSMRFESTNNDVDLGSTSAFSTFNSKVLLDNGNSVLSGEVPETFEREFVTIDSGSGGRLIDSDWDQHKRGHTFSLRTNSRQEAFEMRGLIYALRGRQVSFYVPRSSDDFVVLNDLVNANDSMDITNIGYTQFVQSRQPKNVLRLTKTDGTVLLRTISSSVIVDTTTETLTLDSTWPTAITVDEIERVELVEKVRFDTDRIRIQYGLNGSLAHMVVPLKAVFEIS